MRHVVNFMIGFMLGNYFCSPANIDRFGGLLPALCLAVLATLAVISLKEYLMSLMEGQK